MCKYAIVNSLLRVNFFQGKTICAAAFTLTNCNKEIAEPKAPVTEGIPFEIVAATADTKTENNGLYTKWTTGDALNVFHAEAGSIDYGSNDQFTYAEGSTNKFTGKLTTGLDASKSYDWYALYPVNDKAEYVITTPAGSTDGDGWAYIGHKSGATQNGYNSTAHLAETLCPLYGVVKSVDASTPVSFNMKHIASVVKIVVTNESESPLTVTSVTFTAPEDIVGSYFMNFTDPNNVVCKATKASYVSSTATLNVTGGTELKKGEKAEFYIPIKPFKAAANKLKITVNGYEKTPVSTADVEFKAGKIETVNFKYNNTSTSHQVVYSYSNFSGGMSGSAGTAMTVTNSDPNIELTATGYHKKDATHVKLYAEDSFTVTAKNGVTITKIEISSKSSYPGIWGITSGAGTITSNVWKGTESSSVTLKNTDSKQAQITKITVTYE